MSAACRVKLENVISRVVNDWVEDIIDTGIFDISVALSAEKLLSSFKFLLLLSDD